MAAISAYIGEFFSGDVDPSMPHLVLIWAAVIGGLLVGIGIIWEAWRDGHLWALPTGCVFVGVILEAAATIILFQFDESISAHQKSTIDAQQIVIVSQNDKIIALEKRLMPRTLTAERQQFVADAVRRFAPQRYRGVVSQGADDGILYWQSIAAALLKAGWVVVPMPPGTPGVGNPVAGIPIAAAPGVEILMDHAKTEELSPAALALGNALHADGTIVEVNGDTQSDPNIAERDILLIRIGARVPPP